MSDEREQQIQVADTDAGPRLILAGSIGIGVADQLHQAAVSLAARAESVWVDCAAAEHLDCTALQILLALSRDLETRGQRLVVDAIPSDIEQYLVLAGVADAFVAAPAA